MATQRAKSQGMKKGVPGSRMASRAAKYTGRGGSRAVSRMISRGSALNSAEAGQELEAMLAEGADDDAEYDDSLIYGAETDSEDDTMGGVVVTTTVDGSAAADSSDDMQLNEALGGHAEEPEVVRTVYGGEEDVRAESMAYSGGPIVSVSTSTFAYPLGNGVRFLTAPQSQEQPAASKCHMWGVGRNVGAIAATVAGDKLAYSERGLRPSIHVVEFPGFRRVQVFPGGTTLEYGSVAFSRDGKLLAALGSVPDFKLSVWELTSPEPLVAVVGSAAPCEQVSFDPANSALLCTSGNGRVVFWVLEVRDGRYALVRADMSGMGGVEEHVRPTTAESMAAWHEQELRDAVAGETPFTCHCWIPGHCVLCADANGRIHRIDPTAKTPTLTWRVPNVGAITAMATTKSAVVIGTAEGTVHWLNAENRTVVASVSVGASAVRSISVRKYIMAGTRDGKLMELPVAVQAGQPPQVRLIGDYHSKPITGLCHLPGQNICISSSMDGTLRSWDSISGAPISAMELGVPLTAVCSCKATDLFAAGTENGFVRVFSGADMKRPALVFRDRVHAVAVVRMEFHPAQLFLAVAGKGGRLCILDTATPDVRAIGYIELSADITDMAWNVADKENQLFVTLSGGSVYRFAVPPADKRPPTADMALSFRDLSANAMKLHWAANAIAVDPHGTGISKQFFFVLTEDYSLKRYMMPDRALEPELLDEADITQAKDEVKCHEKQSRCLLMSPDGAWVASGGGDGALMLRQPENIKKAITRAGHGTAGGIGAMCFSPDSRFIFTAGDSEIIRWAVPSATSTAAAAPVSTQHHAAVDPAKFVPYGKAAVNPLVDSPDVLSALTIYEKWKRNSGRDASDMKAIDAEVAEMRMEIAMLTGSLAGIVESNEHGDATEKLTEDEMLVNTEERDALRQEGARQVAALREQIREENLARDLVLARVKEEFFDSMEDNAVVVRGFKKKVEVANYPLRKRSDQELLFQNQLIVLRRTELQETHRQLFILSASDTSSAPQTAAAPSSASAATQQPPGTASSATGAHPSSSNATSLAAPGYFKGSMRLAKADADARRRRLGLTPGMQHAQQQNVEYEEPDDPSMTLPGDQCREKELRALLYHPFDVHTPARKRTQMHLLRFVIRDMEKQFNQEVNRFLDMKNDAITKISERNARMREIAEELREKVDIWQPALEEAERPESVFEVRDDEVHARKLTAEGQGGASPGKGQHSSSDAEEESALRGLKVMMGGKLGDRSAPSLLDGGDEDAVADMRPEWYGTREPETEEEKKAAREYEKRAQVRREERQKHRKALETELKKIAASVEELCTAFDDKLQHTLQALRMKTDFLICQEKLRIARLAAALLVQEGNDETEIELAERLEKLKKKKTKSSTAAGEARSRHEAAKAEHESRLQNDRIVEKTFRREFERSEREELFPQLLKAFKYRKRPRTETGRRRQDQSAGRQPTASSQSSSQPQLTEEWDAFAGLEIDPGVGFQRQLDAAAVAAAEESLAVTPERPEALGSDDAAWNRLLELRSEKIKSEIAVRRAAIAVEETRAAHSEAQRRNERTKKQLEDAVQAVAEFRKQQIWDSMNLEMMLRLKQGQVEVEEAPVVTRLDDAVLIDSGSVEELNTHIRSLSKEKAELLEEIKDAKKVIAKKKWENTGIDMQIQDIQEKAKYLQLLRVTKQLQEFLKEGGEEVQQRELAALERRAEHERKQYELKMEELRKRQAKLIQDTKAKERENDRLSHELAAARSSVAERNKIHQAQQQAAAAMATQQGGAGSTTRLEKLYQTERLESTIKGQAKEIQTLKAKLALARQQTLPII